MIFEFICEECRLIYEKDASISKPPKRKKCPECGKMNPRAYITPPAVHFATNDFDFETNRAKNEKFIKYGMDPDTANEFYNDSIRNSRKRMQSGGEHYRRWKPNLENMEKLGLAKKVSADEANRKRHEAKNLSRHVHKASGADVNKTSKQGF